MGSEHKGGVSFTYQTSNPWFATSDREHSSTPVAAGPRLDTTRSDSSCHHHDFLHDDIDRFDNEAYAHSVAVDSGNEVDAGDATAPAAATSYADETLPAALHDKDPPSLGRQEVQARQVHRTRGARSKQRGARTRRYRRHAVRGTRSSAVAASRSW